MDCIRKKQRASSSLVLPLTNAVSYHIKEARLPQIHPGQTLFLRKERGFFADDSVRRKGCKNSPRFMEEGKGDKVVAFLRRVIDS